MSNNEREPASRVFRAAQDALLSVFKWGSERASGGGTTDASERISGSQDLAVQMMSAMTQVWLEMAKEGVKGPEGVRKFMERFGKEMPPMGGAMPSPEAMKQLMELWRQGANQFSNVWGAPGAGSAFEGGLPSSVRQAFTDFATSPGFGLSREYQARLNHALASWMDYQQRDTEYRALLSKAWMEAFTAVMETFASQAAEGQRPRSAREAMQAWIERADEVFIRLFRTPDFSRAQSELMNATMRLRADRRGLMEDVLRANDVPTKSDLDEAHRLIYLLRKELKGVKRELAALKRVVHGQEVQNGH